jgi:hypothetical protein
MTILGTLALIVGASGFLLLFTGAGGSLMPALAKMPLGLTGWAILAAVGVVLLVLGRRPAD